MKKKILAIVLTVALILTAVPIMAFADSTVYYGKDNYVYQLTADPDTGSVPSGFGTAAYNGKIWTDKSVIINSAGTGFNINLKALAQEYVSTASSSRTQETLADVVFILDFTSSMTGKTKGGSGYDVVVSDADGNPTSNYETRITALVDSFNIAADIICSANKNNRISVYDFYGRGTGKNPAKVTNIMTLGNYTPGTDGKYLVLSDSDTVKTSKNMKKDGTTYTQQTQDLTSYTCSQYGIAMSLNGLISNINSDTGTTARKPYVIFMTDGAVTEATKSYDTQNMSTIQAGELQATDYTNGDAKDSAATILTACVWKDRLQDAYNTYNKKKRS